MEKQRYITRLLVREYEGPKRQGNIKYTNLNFDSNGRPVFDRKLVRSFEFSIFDHALGREVAFIEIGRFDPKVTTISNSRENQKAALSFFRTFRQSPFRLLLFSSFTFLKKINEKNFRSDSGSGDEGKAHEKQLRERLFFERDPKSKRGIFHDHDLGFFPTLSFSELDKILASNKAVPERLLPPESVLRKVRAKSFAALRFKNNKAKYKTARAKIVRK
jgi:hypothetical protein